MDLTGYQEMDPSILYSIINMRLRNSRMSLAEVLDDLDIDLTAFTAHMADHDFHYNEKTNQFR